MPKFKGPYYVTQKTDQDTYKLRCVKDNKEHKSFVHHNRLKHYESPEDRQHFQDENNGASPQTASSKIQRSDTTSDKVKSSENEMREIEMVIKISQKNKKFYLIQWADCQDRTWENVDAIPPKLIQEYHIHRTKKGTKRRKYKKKINKN